MPNKKAGLDCFGWHDLARIESWLDLDRNRDRIHEGVLDMQAFLGRGAEIPVRIDGLH